MWHVTCDTWYVTHGGEWAFPQNFSSLALTVWDRQYLEDSERITQWITEVFVEQPRLHPVCWKCGSKETMWKRRKNIIIFDLVFTSFSSSSWEGGPNFVFLICSLLWQWLLFRLAKSKPSCLFISSIYCGGAVLNSFFYTVKFIFLCHSVNAPCLNSITCNWFPPQNIISDSVVSK